MSSAPTTRQPIHLPDMPFLNRLLEDGLPAGQLIGLVGPAGGGKTLLSLQLSYALASAGTHVLYLCLDRADRFEERLPKLINGDFVGTPDTHEEERRRAMRTQIEEHLRISEIEHLGLTGELEAIVSEFDPQPDLIVIDQLALWIRSNREPVSAQTIRSYCAGLKEFAHRTGITVLLPHQLKGALKSGLAIRLPELTDAEDSNSFGSDDVDIGLFIGVHDDQQLCWLARPATEQLELVWLDGDHARFRSIGPPGEYFAANPRTGQFSLTANARSLGLSTPADVNKHLEGRRFVFSTNPSPVLAPAPAGDTQSSSAVPRASEPVSAMSPADQELFLAAANWIAPALDLDHGKKMIALFSLDRSDGSCRPLLRFVLWCRCNGRRDFIDLLCPDPEIRTAEITALYTAEELNDFHPWLLEQARQNGWNGNTLVPWFTDILNTKLSFNRLVKLYADELSRILQNIWCAHRDHFALQACERTQSSPCIVQDSAYGDKNDKPKVWLDALTLFITHAKSPSAFLSDYSNLYGAVPWPASFPSLISEVECINHNSCRFFDYPEEILNYLLDADLALWEVAAMALNAGAAGTGELNFIHEHYWIELVWRALGNPELIAHIEARLKPFVRLAAR